MTSNLVYSTEHGRMCPACGKTKDACVCKNGKKNRAPKGDGRVRVSRETKGRKGKGVTVVIGLPLKPDDLKDLAKDLKRLCGSGGTAKNGIVEIQGEHRDIVVDALIKRGFSAKRSGG